MTYKQIIDEYVPMHDPPDVHVNAKALRCMAEGIHYDTVPGEVHPQFAFVMRLERIDRPTPVLRWQRSLPGIRVIQGPRPRPSRKKMLAGAA